MESSSSDSENTNNFKGDSKNMSLREIKSDEPDWWPSLQFLEENLTPTGKEFMYILRVLVYNCCEFFKKPSINVNLNDHFNNDNKSQVRHKRKHSIEENYPKKIRRTLIPKPISGTNLSIENKKTSYTYSTIGLSDVDVHEQNTNKQDEFLTSLGLKAAYVSEKNTNISCWKSVKFKLAPSIPFSSNLGQMLMKRDNHVFPDSSKRHRLERVERYINQPYKESLNIKYEVTYPGKKLKGLIYHWYKFPYKRMPQKCIHNYNNVAVSFKPLTVKVARENLNTLREKMQIEQGRKLQIVLPKLSIEGLKLMNKSQMAIKKNKHNKNKTDNLK